MADKAPNAEEHANAVIREQLAIQAELAANPRDETIQGGRLIVNGVLVNAYGNPIDKDGKLKNPQDAFKQAV